MKMAPMSFFIVLLSVTSCLGLLVDRPAGFRSRIHVRRDRLSGRSTTTKLHETFATGTGLSIEPTVYQEDLYGILGLSLNATRVQLRDAYWAIAFKTHPDRNNTPEALCEFRNASHAYKVLGRSEKTRSDYDSKYRTKLAIESMDQIGRDVIAPFAMDVAMPLLNLTVRGISSFAVPFFKDAYQQSTAVFQAAFKPDESMVDEEEELTGFEAITRAANAAMRTGLEQRIRRTKDSIGNTADRLDATATQLKETIEKESELKVSMEELKSIGETDKISLKDITSETETAKGLLSAAEQSVKTTEEECIKQAATVALLMESVTQLSDIRNSEEEEISRLESALSNAREKNRNTLIKQTTLDINISAENRTNEVLISSFDQASKEKSELQLSYNTVEKELERLRVKSAKSAKETIEKASAAEKISYQRQSLERKNAQLNVKKDGLESSLKNLEKEWNAKESETAYEKNRISQKKKDAEEKINERKRIERDLAEIAEMEYSIRKREKEVELMELERNQLVQQEKIEREKLREDEIIGILKRADDIAAQNLNKNTTTPPPPSQSKNPFSRKEKYVKQTKNNIANENVQKLEILERKRMAEWMAQRKAEEYVNYDDFYLN